MLRRFRDQPVHMGLLMRAADALKEDERVLGLYVSGNPDTDEFSDVDLMIVSKREDIRSLEEDRYMIASKVGEIRSEAMALVPHTYVVNYEEGVKMDYCFHVYPERPRPDKAYIDIIYDPTGHLAELMEASKGLSWDIDLDELRNRVQHYYVTFSYTVAKLERGELWDARDCVEFYRNTMITLESILAKRKKEGYRRIEQKLPREKLAHLEDTIPQDLSRPELVRCIDSCRSYFNKYLKDKLVALGLHPDTYAETMNQYYEEGKKRVLSIV